MNDLLERYLAAVCTYFMGSKKESVYKDLKQQLIQLSKEEDLEEILIHYGHPLSIAYSYGYRPYISHIFNPKVTQIVEKSMFSLAFIYLFFATIFSLQQLNCLPIPPIPVGNHIIPWILNHSTITMLAIMIIASLLLILFDYKYSINQTHDLTWNKEQLYALPHPSRYPLHYSETIIMMVFLLFFLCFYIYFYSQTIMQIQNTTYQMIHLLTSFFQPFVMMMILDYIVDMTKKMYSKKYLRYSTFINIFIFIAIIIFIINSHYLQDYLLPVNTLHHYITINCFIITAICFITFISLYKILRNIKHYYSLYKK